jgi:uncharacterized protein
MKLRTWHVLAVSAAVVAAGMYLAALQVVPPAAAGGLLYPLRIATREATPSGCVSRNYDGDGVRLRGWQCRAPGNARATLVFLHGMAGNRGAAAGLVQRFLPTGLDVVAYDSRAHGESTGQVCTYGYREKKDLERVLDTVRPGRVVLLGSSLGAAVALQAAAEDARVSGVIAAETFSDLRTVARERAPRLLTEGLIARSFAVAEARGGFHVDDVSPVASARRIHVPVLLVHGADDTDTPPAHSQRVFQALAGPRELILVKGAGHNQALRGSDTWRRIDAWLAEVLGG